MNDEQFVSEVKNLAELDSEVLRAGGKEGGRRKRAGGRTRKGGATVLQTAVSGEELDDVRSQLGDAYKELFGQSGASA